MNLLAALLGGIVGGGVPQRPYPTTPLIVVTAEGDADRYNKLMLLKTEYETTSGRKLQPRQTLTFGNCSGGESGIPYILSMSTCKTCGPLIAKELRHVADFFASVRKDMTGKLKDGSDFNADEILPKEPVVFTALTQDGEYMSVLTFTVNGDKEHAAYKELVDIIVEKTTQMLELGMTSARLSIDGPCEETSVPQTTSETEENHAAASQN